MEVSWNSGTSKSSILIGFSIINHPFGGIPILGNHHIRTIRCLYWAAWWWLEHDFFHILGMSSSQLTFIFFRGVETTNQIVYDFCFRKCDEVPKIDGKKYIGTWWLSQKMMDILRCVYHFFGKGWIAQNSSMENMDIWWRHLPFWDLLWYVHICPWDSSSLEIHLSIQTWVSKPGDSNHIYSDSIRF